MNKEYVLKEGYQSEQLTMKTNDTRTEDGFNINIPFEEIDRTEATYVTVVQMIWS